MTDLLKTLEANLNKQYTTLKYTEVKEDDGISLYVDLPGVEKDDISVEVENNKLKIQATRKKPDALVYSTSFYGEFKESFIIPNTLDLDTLSAKYENGVLYITIKTDKVKCKKVEVK